MNFGEHRQSMLRTEQSKVFDFNPRLFHGILGLSSEMGEMTMAYEKVEAARKQFEGNARYKQLKANYEKAKVNLKEELGDCYWYTNLILHEMGITCGGAVAQSITSPNFHKMRYKPGGFLKDLVICSGVLLDSMKAKIYYNRDLVAEDIIGLTGSCIMILNLLCKYYGLTTSEVLEANNRKLEERYPEKFTTEDANERDLKAEADAVAGKS